MKNFSKLYIFLILLFLFLTATAVENKLSYKNSYISSSARVIRTSSFNNIYASYDHDFRSFDITSRLIENSVQDQGGWKFYEGKINRAQINYISGGMGGNIELLRPLTIAKKSTSNVVISTHLICDLLEEYFMNKGAYKHEHVPPVLGVYNGGYYYVWVHGGENIFPQYQGIITKAEEGWEVEYAFDNAGIDIMHDTMDTDDSFHNIIISKDYDWYSDHVVPILKKWKEEGSLFNKQAVIEIPGDKWTRIDFDENSMLVNAPKLGEFIEKNKEDIKEHLEPWKYNLLQLVYKCRGKSIELKEVLKQKQLFFSWYLKEALEKEDYIKPWYAFQEGKE